MSLFSPEQLASWTGGSWTQLPADPLQGFATDSRQLRAGQVFVALKTDKRDGHDFVLGAAASGASAALVSHQVAGSSLPQLVVKDPLLALQAIAREHRRLFKGRVIGITGSCGKTSTKDLLALLLGGQQEGILATEGNFNNHIGVPLTLTRIDLAQHKLAVVEAGISGVGEMEVLASMIEPDVSLTTLVAPAHLLELGGLQGVAREKSRLSVAVKPLGVAVFPRQCDEFSSFRELGVRRMVLEPAEVLRPSEPPKDKVFFTVTQRGDTTAIALAYGLPPPLVFTMRRVSSGMAQNAALALCSALWLGVDPSLIQQRLSTWKPAHWRGEMVNDAGRLLYVDCYNANPASMRDALQNFSELSPESAPRLYVLGCMEELGPDSSHFHRELGRSLSLRQGDKAFVIGGEAESLRAGLLEAGAKTEQVELLPSAAVALPGVAAWRGSVFVKGSRKYQLETVLAGTSTAGSTAH